MNKCLAAVLAGVLAFVIGSAALAVNKWDEGVIVSANTHVRGLSRDDQAIYACARSMMKTMFPGVKRIQVFVPGGQQQVFNDSVDDSMPGYRMAVLLSAASVASGKTLGTAECDVSPNARVLALRPGAKALAPDPEIMSVQ